MATGINISEEGLETINCTNRGVFINFPTEWEIAKWIRCTEFVITVVLNFVLIILLQRKGKSSNLVYFVFHLAISDLAVALFHILPLSIGHFTRSWSLGLIVCKLQFYISNVALYASTYLIMTISIDRLLCIMNPMGIMRKMKTFRVGMVAGPWTLSLVINVPLLFWTTVVTGCGSQICSPDLRGVREIAILLNAVFLMFIPSFALIVCYSGIVAHLCRHHQTIDKLTGNGTRGGTFRKCGNNVLPKAKRRSVVMTFVVSITFIVCWMPFILAVLLNLYGNLGYGGWFDIMIALAPLNSMLNPIIFFALNTKTLVS